MVNVNFMCLVGSSSGLEGKTKTPAVPGKGEVLHGNHPLCHKQFL